MPDLLALLRPRGKGQTARQTLSLRVPQPLQLALQKRAEQEQTTVTYVLLSAALQGDKQLSQLFKQYASTETSGKAPSQHSS